MIYEMWPLLAIVTPVVAVVLIRDGRINRRDRKREGR